MHPVPCHLPLQREVKGFFHDLMIRVGRPWNLLLLWVGPGPPGLFIYMLVLLTRLIFNPHTGYSDVGGAQRKRKNIFVLNMEFIYVCFQWIPARVCHLRGGTG